MLSISDLNKQLQKLPPKKVADICIRISKHKKENKELLDYLLNEADDEESFRERIKAETEQQFADMNSSNLYLAKKIFLHQKTTFRLPFSFFLTQDSFQI